MNKATQWLNNPDRKYQDGVLIYKEVFGMDKQYAFFANVSDPKPGGLHFNLLTEKIRVAERRIGNALPDPVETMKEVNPEIRVKPIKQDQSTRFVDNHLVEVTSLPAELQEKFFRNKQIMKELSGEHIEMKAAADDEARATHLEMCKELEQEKDANWKLIDDWWKENGQKAEKQDGQKAEETNADQRMETVRKAILRVKKELKDKTMDLKKVMSKKEKLAAWETELADLKAKKDAV